MRSKKEIQKKPRATDLLSLDAVIEILSDPKKLAWINFKAGFVRGFAGVFGVAIAFLLISFLVSMFGGLPYVGDMFRAIGDVTRSAK